MRNIIEKNNSSKTKVLCVCPSVHPSHFVILPPTKWSRIPVGYVLPAWKLYVLQFQWSPPDVAPRGVPK